MTYFKKMIGKGYRHLKLQKGVHVFIENDTDSPVVVVALGAGHGRYICREINEWYRKDSNPQFIYEKEIKDFKNMDCAVFWNDTKKDVSQYTRKKIVSQIQ